jgi:D-alanyl-D-alanine carboxypeptidase/D-alanyl-D-alanine-endopeptidase (penicillin-binding protein 4)
MKQKIAFLLCIFIISIHVSAQTPQPIRQLLNAEYMKGATFSLTVKEVQSGETYYAYEANREVIPASVLKTVTTATALELLGESFRFPTTIAYDGRIENGVLQGNLYIIGSGDPTLGSEHFINDRNSFSEQKNSFIPLWIKAIKEQGIHTITGSVISDESIFDTEGVSPKWLREDMGNYYGAGSYGLSVFDNQYKLTLRGGSSGSIPAITGIQPDLSSIHFHNYLKTATVSTDSAFILGSPFANDRYLYGVVPANRGQITLKGDIPDPALFLANYLTTCLQEERIIVNGSPSCHRILSEEGKWRIAERHTITTTYSPTIQEIITITNNASHNLFADALLKYLGLRYQPKAGEVISSFGKGIEVIKAYWKSKGIDVSSLQMYDGSGLAPTDKVTAALISDILTYMATKATSPEIFIQSLPQAGIEGSVRNFLRGSKLQGKTRLKSGGMSRVRCYAGYINHNGKQYAVALFANNYTCEGKDIIQALERLILNLF